MKVIKTLLPFSNQVTNALIFIPSGEVKSHLAVMTHGYTSHKDSILTWASRLSDEGIPTILFDLPGHYLGNFSEVQEFDHFKENAHQLFAEAFKELKNKCQKELPTHVFNHVILLGHSLGALLALKSHSLDEFQSFEKTFIAVGFGMASEEAKHIFETPFYKSTLHLREQLVSPSLNAKNVLPWIALEKKELSITQENIHLISGDDDIVVGKDGAEKMYESLKNHNNVKLHKPKRLSHHQPELAAPHIKSLLKDIGII